MDEDAAYANTWAICEVAEHNRDRGYAKLNPLFCLQEQDWSHVASPAEMFPSEGMVFWWDPATEAEPRTLWAVHLKVHPSYDGISKREKYEVSRGKYSQLYEIIGFPGAHGDADLVHRLVECGVDIPHQVHSRIILRLDSGQWLGPIRLRIDVADQKWRLHEEEDELRLPLCSGSDDATLELDIEGKRRLFIDPLSSIPSADAFLNAQTSGDLLRGLLKRVRKLDRNTFDALQVTYRVFDGYLEALGRASLHGDNELVEQARRRRLQATITELQDTEAHVKEVAAALLAWPGVAERLDEEIKSEVQRRESEIIAALSERQGELRRLTEDIQKSEDGLHQLEARIAATREELSKQGNEWERRIGERIRRIIEDPAEELAQAAVVRAMFATEKRQDAGKSKVDVSHRSGIPENAIPLTDLEDAKTSLSREAVAKGQSPVSVAAIFSTMLAGRLPAIHGPEARELLSLIGQVICGRQPFWSSVGGNFCHPLDLFGYMDEQGGGLVESPGAILSFLRAAKASEHMHLLVLEGINRSPLEAYLSPVLLGLCAHVSSVPIPPISRRGSSSSLPAGISEWPRNVLICGTLIEGPSSFKIPAGLLQHISLVPTWMGMDDFPPQQHTEGVAASCLDRSVWDSALLAIRGAPVGQSESILKDLPNRRLFSTQMVERALASFSTILGDDYGKGAFIATTILPALAQHAAESMMQGMDILDATKKWVLESGVASARFITETT
jgi:hypothetical protein